MEKKIKLGLEIIDWMQTMNLLVYNLLYYSKKNLFKYMIILFIFFNCTTSSDNSNNEKNTLYSVIAYKELQLLSLNSSIFELNGTWDSYTEGVAQSNTKTFINALSNSGVWVDDSSGFGGYSSCKIISQIDKVNGIIITQNPPNNGGCFSGDTNKGKYSKIFYFTQNSKYYYCEAVFGKSSISEALNSTYKADKTTLTKGCGDTQSAWSRLEKVN